MYKIPICQPSLPNFDEFVEGLRPIWESRWLSNFAKYATQYEEIAKNYIGAKYAMVLGNADVGLILGLSALDLKTGDEVILPSFTFNSTANAVKWNQLTPVFADIDKDDWCIDPKDVKRKITKKTKVVLATHVFGNPCQIDELRDICKKNNLVLMFDSAHGYGSEFQGKKVGSLGDIEVFSFSGTKVVTSAEGGVVVTNDKKIYEKLLLARNYGFMNDYDSKRNGANGKISEFNALLGCLNLPKIDILVKIREKIAESYRQQLKDIGDISFQVIRPGNRSTYKDFAILTKGRNELSKFLEDNGVQTKKYFYPVHKMAWYKSETDLANTDLIAERCLCLPIYNEMKKEDLQVVINLIKEFYERNK